MVNAIFFDRDGVVNKLVVDDNGLIRSPFKIEEIILVDDIETIFKLLNKTYKLFMISNQPGACKGECTYNELMEVIDWFKNRFAIYFTDFYFCLHHPSRCKCLCRKPGNYFLLDAITKYGIDVSSSYLIGDRLTDIECGDSVGLNTILVESNTNLYNILVYNHLI